MVARFTLTQQQCEVPKKKMKHLINIVGWKVRYTIWPWHVEHSFMEISSEKWQLIQILYPVLLLSSQCGHPPSILSVFNCLHNVAIPPVFYLSSPVFTMWSPPSFLYVFNCLHNVATPPPSFLSVFNCLHSVAIPPVFYLSSTVFTMWPSPQFSIYLLLSYYIHYYISVYRLMPISILFSLAVWIFGIVSPAQLFLMWSPL